MSSREHAEDVKNRAQKYLNSSLFKQIPLSSGLKRRLAFTLAEVLVTLLIIGVIASLTIPGLIANTNKAELVTKLKKEQSVLMQTFNLIAMDAGGSITNDSNFSSSTGDTATKANAMNEFANKMNVVKNCNNGTGCFYTSPLKFLGGTTYSSNIDSTWIDGSSKAILADGAIIRIVINNTNCTENEGSAPTGSPLNGSVCGYIHIDVNGASGPNQLGRDYFEFWITKTGIYPFGTFNDGYSCDITSSTWTTSVGCTGKVLIEGAMNY